MIHFRAATDTAAICIFDLAQLKHRLKSRPDWWTVPAVAVAEMNAGRVVFADVGSDGSYAVSIEAGSAPTHEGQCAEIQFSSGTVFVGPAENVTGRGFEPDPKLGGVYLHLDVGRYQVCVSRVGPFSVSVQLLRMPDGTATNNLSDYIRV